MTHGLGNRRSIHLSYGANGGFPSFPPLIGQSATTQTRQTGRSGAAQGSAQFVREMF